MGRRKLLLAFAAVIAAVGTLLVFLYVQSADNRAAAQYETVEVLSAVAPIEVGETIEAAAGAGKFQLTSMPQNAVLAGAVGSTDSLAGKAANTRIYPGEQIVPEKFGGEAAPTTLPIPEGQVALSVQLSDTARVAGFVNPGSEVAVFYNGTAGGTYNRLLLPRVTVIGVGSTTPISTTTTDESGAATTEALPRTLITLAVPQADAQRIMYAVSNGEIVFTLLTEDSTVQPDPGTTEDNLFR